MKFWNLRRSSSSSKNTRKCASSEEETSIPPITSSPFCLPAFLTARTFSAELWSLTPIRSRPLRRAPCTTPSGDMSRPAQGDRHVCTCRSALMRLSATDPRLVQSSYEFEGRQAAHQDRYALFLGLCDSVLFRLPALDQDDAGKVLMRRYSHDVLVDVERDPEGP